MARLIHAMGPLGYASDVVSLMRPGPVGDQLRRSGVVVRDAGMLQGRISPRSALRLSRAARDLAPAVVQGWMYHGNLAASWLALTARGPRPPIVWNIRHSVHDLAHEKLLSRSIIRLGAALSRWPAAIVYNSKVSAGQHQALGFRPDRATVIPNGFDCERFRPAADARARLRGRLGLPAGTTLVGMVARNHPMKDAGNLLRAVAALRAARVDLHLVLVGRGFGPDDAPAVEAVARHGLGEAVSLLGERHDVPDLLPGIDVLAMPSAWGEAFPNVLGEAMASGVPCVATAVGDSAWIVGEHGLVVPPRDSAALAAALRRLIELGPEGRAELGSKARARVVAEFSLAEIVRRYADLYAGVMARS